jgi:hypothetical protein
LTARPLTQGEITLAKTVFGDSIDYAAVKVHDRKYSFLQPAGVAMAPNGHIYMNDIYRDDYAADAHRVGTFIHEMTHVWQFQNKVLNPLHSGAALMLKHKFNYGSCYAYKLDGGKDLLDYNMEQQASIVEDYFQLRHQGRYNWQGSCANDAAATPDRMALYEKVLEKFLKNPAYPRKDAGASLRRKHKPG